MCYYKENPYCTIRPLVRAKSRRTRGPDQNSNDEKMKWKPSSWVGENVEAVHVYPFRFIIIFLLLCCHG